MALCTGGSQPKTGVTDTFALSFDYMASILPPGLVWLKPFLPYIRPVFLADVVAYCGTEPTLPDLTGLTIGAVLAGGEFGAAFIAAEAIAQLVTYYAWFDLCECVTGGPPTPATPPGAPADLPVPPPAPVTSADCGQITAHIAGSSAGGTSLIAQRLLPVGPRHLTLTFVDSRGGAGPHRNINWSISFQGPLTTDDAGGNITGGVAPDTVATAQIAIPLAAVYFVINTNGSGGDSSDDFTVIVDFPCPGQPVGQPAVPCCPPDPVETGLLSQILDLVTLLQRQAAPMAYVYGANHTALAGHGSFAVSQLLGVSVDVTTLPGHYGSADGSPIELFDLGFVTLGTADGYELSRRIDHDGSLVLPPLGGVYTAVGYTLNPGVVVSIRELVREP